MVYSNSKYSKEIKKRDLNQFDIRFCKEPKFVIINDGYVLPHRACEGMTYGIGGVLDSNKNFVASSAFSLIMNENPDKIDWGGFYENNDDNVRDVEKTVIWGGFVNNDEWGHFIIDWSVRLWYALQKDTESNVIFCVRTKVDYFHANIQRLLTIGGINPERILIIQPYTEVLHCRKIIVPETSLSSKYYTESYFTLFNNAIKFVSSEKIEREKYGQIYFTRTELSPRKEIGEEEIEKEFVKKGFVSIAPEKCSVDEQIFLINNCRRVASLEGSAAHNIVFAKSGVRQIIIEKGAPVNIRQIYLNQIKQIPADYIGAMPSCNIFRYNKENLFIVGKTKELISYLDVKNDFFASVFKWAVDYIQYVGKIIYCKIVHLESKVISLFAGKQ